MRIFVTGPTGFLGFHFVKEAVCQGHQVLCLRRSTSRSLFDDEIENKIQWVIDDNNLKSKVEDFAPDVLFHSAWAGVHNGERDNKQVQMQNVELSLRMFQLAPYKQIICLGSQAEYGFYHGPVSENLVESMFDIKKQYKTLTEYGATKLYCLDKLRDFCENKNIEWQWIRIFTIFGPNMTGGLVKLAIQLCLNKTELFDTTAGYQKYSYLYAEDYAKALCYVLGAKGKSGIYNLSQPREIHSNYDILETIKKMLASDINYNYGALPYVSEQIMYMDGDVSKFETTFGKIPHTEFSKALLFTINSYIKQHNESI